MSDTQHITIGRMAFVRLHRGQYVDIPAKIDTGADSSSIDVSYIYVNNKGELEYTLFQPTARYYDGRIHKTKNFRVKVVKSSTGHVEIRYTVTIPILIASKSIMGTFTLTDRSKNMFPILIGAKMLKNKFAVNVAYNYDEYRKHVAKQKNIYNHAGSKKYTEASKQNPVQFYKEVYLKQDNT